MTEQPYGPREITDRFDALTKQVDRVLRALEEMRRDSQMQFAALDNKFVTKDALTSEVKLLNQRQTDWEHQRDLMTDGYEKQRVVQDKRFEAIDDKFKDIEDRKTQRQMVMVGQFVWPLAVALVTAFVLGYFQ
jgi:hypothetical protein